MLGVELDEHLARHLFRNKLGVLGHLLVLVLVLVLVLPIGGTGRNWTPSWTPTPELDLEGRLPVFFGQLPDELVQAPSVLLEEAVDLFSQFKHFLGLSKCGLSSQSKLRD